MAYETMMDDLPGPVLQLTSKWSTKVKQSGGIESDWPSKNVLIQGLNANDSSWYQLVLITYLSFDRQEFLCIKKAFELLWDLIAEYS